MVLQKYFALFKTSPDAEIFKFTDGCHGCSAVLTPRKPFGFCQGLSRLAIHVYIIPFFFLSCPGLCPQAPHRFLSLQKRHLVECFFMKIKDHRRIAMRFEKPACRFLAFIHPSDAPGFAQYPVFRCVLVRAGSARSRKGALRVAGVRSDTLHGGGRNRHADPAGSQPTPSLRTPPCPLIFYPSVGGTGGTDFKTSFSSSMVLAFAQADIPGFQTKDCPPN